MPGTGQTILLVEDDPAVLEVAWSGLEELGYQVLPATTGAEALETFEQYRGQIALVLADVVMPGIGGVELLRALRARDPDIKVLLLGGYPVGEEEIVEVAAGWLQKPLTLEQLARVVSSALAAGGGTGEKRSSTGRSADR